MNGPDAAAQFRQFMAGHLVVSILVRPGLCTGLDDFPPVDPLRLDLSHSFSPPMFPEATDTGLDFRASFNRSDRLVHVPWAALLWAGIPGTGTGKAPAQTALAALPPPNATAPQLKEGKLIHVDFRAPRKGKP